MSVSLQIAGRDYPIDEALAKASLSDLYHLKVKTGIGMKTLKNSLDALTELVDPEAFLESAEILLALNALVWLCRRRAGESLTIDEANAFPVADLKFVTSGDADGEGEPDPT